MDLSSDQIAAIRDWAKTASYVSEVRLFGSRAKGTNRPDSDVDIGVVLAAGSKPEIIRGHWFALWGPWRNELTERLGLKAHMALINDPDSDNVRRSCDECSELLFRRSPST